MVSVAGLSVRGAPLAVGPFVSNGAILSGLKITLGLAHRLLPLTFEA
jgi:hypothetical protein